MMPMIEKDGNDPPTAPLDSGFRRNDEGGNAGTTARNTPNINATPPSQNNPSLKSFPIIHIIVQKTSSPATP